MHQRTDILEILNERMTEESKWILYTLKTSQMPITKENLWELTNENYLKKNENNNKILSSRYVLDIHAARLEGAGLVDVQQLGRVRVYSVSELGKEIFNNK